MQALIVAQPLTWSLLWDPAQDELLFQKIYNVLRKWPRLAKVVFCVWLVLSGFMIIFCATIACVLKILYMVEEFIIYCSMHPRTAGLRD